MVAIVSASAAVAVATLSGSLGGRGVRRDFYLGIDRHVWGLVLHG